MDLHKKVIFITGGSRGIGFSIGMRAAKDGARIVIASKTTEPHPKLPGTIYTAADEIIAAGGEALPIATDIRDENAIQDAVDLTIKTFGGIDILVNNASAISLTDTLHTTMKKFDLMHQINTRGTFAVSQACIPHLLEAKNPHILNMSPPLNMKPNWFANHVAYTMAKYGMSMCALGMAEEFKEHGIAVNSLWPETAIATAALQMLGDKEIYNRSRKPEIVADAAYWILTQPSRQCTGNFFIDETVLRDNGITDFSSYVVVPGHSLGRDYFLD